LAELEKHIEAVVEKEQHVPQANSTAPTDIVTK
jgi:hypothetical protein